VSYKCVTALCMDGDVDDLHSQGPQWLDGSVDIHLPIGNGGSRDVCREMVGREVSGVSRARALCASQTMAGGIRRCVAGPWASKLLRKRSKSLLVYRSDTNPQSMSYYDIHGFGDVKETKGAKGDLLVCDIRQCDRSLTSFIALCRVVSAWWVTYPSSQSGHRWHPPRRV